MTYECAMLINVYEQTLFGLTAFDDVEQYEDDDEDDDME